MIARFPTLRDQRAAFGISLSLAIVVVWAFLPALRNSFVGYDDGLYVTQNPDVQKGWGWAGMLWAFRHAVAGNWHPLTLLSHMLDCQLYGLQPWGHHLTSVLFHAANTVLLFLLFHRMTGALWRCALLAALFGLHPLRAESVAWVAERKDVLSTFFWLLTVWAYVGYSEVQGPRSKVQSLKSKVQSQWSVGCGLWSPYFASLAFFALGLMCKPMLVTLPLILLLLDYWPLRRAEPSVQRSRLQTLWSLILEKLPFFALAGVFVLITFSTQQTSGAIVGELPLSTRAANAAISCVRYIGKLAWPVNLTVFYPYPRQFQVTQVLGSVALLLAMCALGVWQARKRPYLLFGWLWFCTTLLPVIGLVQVGDQGMADRYTYVPSIGLLVFSLWALHDVLPRGRGLRRACLVAAEAAVLVCAFLTRRQVGFWRDDETLWSHAVAATKDNDFAHHNLGILLASKGRLEEAIRHLEATVQLSPGKASAHTDLACALRTHQRLTESVAEFEQASRLEPANAGIQNDLALTLARQGRREEAISHYAEALRLKPGFTEAHYNLGLALESGGAYREAAEHFQAVLRLNPNQTNATLQLERAVAAERKFEQAAESYRSALQTNPADARARAGWGRVLLDAGRLNEAIEQYSEAARLEPKNAQLQYQLGVALTRRGETEKAARRFQLALDLDPSLAAAHYALGVLRQRQQRLAEAIRHWRAATQLAPQLPDAFNNLAWALATASQAELRNGTEALKLATRAVQLSGTNNVGILDTLAAAYAEAGQYTNAVSVARQAQAAAKAQGASALAMQIEQRLACYTAGQPWREDAPAP